MSERASPPGVNNVLVSQDQVPVLPRGADAPRAQADHLLMQPTIMEFLVSNLMPLISMKRSLRKIESVIFIQNSPEYHTGLVRNLL